MKANLNFDFYHKTPDPKEPSAEDIIDILDMEKLEQEIGMDEILEKAYGDYPDCYPDSGYFDDDYWVDVEYTK